MIYKKSWKYILIKDESCQCQSLGYFRIKSLKDFSNIHKNDIGGFIRGYHNLSQKGDCWIYNDAEISGKASVSENAQVSRSAIIIGHAQVLGNAFVSGNARVFGLSMVTEDFNVSEIYEDNNTKTEESLLTKVKKWFIRKLGNIF